jgi:hypothetical protein
MRNMIPSLLILTFILSGASLAPVAGATAFMPKHPLYCEFWTGSQLLTLPSAFMIYDPATKTVYTRSGSPLTTHTYQNVSAAAGSPPYYKHGFTVTAFGDVPVLSVSDKCFDTIPLLAYLLDNHEATWGKVAGFPATLNSGLCFERPPFPDDFRGW